MPTPTYDKICKLADQLQQERRVTLRREVGKRLLQAISQADVRRKLALEATPKSADQDEPSIAATRCHALSQLWTIIIQRAISVTQHFAMGVKKSTAKPNADDITLPYRLLVQCDKPDPSFDDNSLGITKLSRKTARYVLNFSLNMLANEKAVELAEVTMLEMLNHICARTEYVGCFKHSSDLPNILNELSFRLSKGEDGSIDHRVFLQAARAFESLLLSCQSLGIQLHDLLPECIELVSNWCKGHISADTVKPSSDVLPYFYNAVSSLLQSHTEHAIGPMKQHGRAILSFARRSYALAKGPQKNALNKYLLAHLLVAQAAGKIQGLLPGDLGNLGKASLTERQVSILLNLVVKDIENVVSIQDSIGKPRKRIGSKRGRHAIWRALDSRQCRHLELCARLMACAQRLYLSRVEWELIDDHTEDLTKMLGMPGPGIDDWTNNSNHNNGPCPPEELATSPWVQYVIQNLFALVSQNPENELMASSTCIGHTSQDSTEQSKTTNARSIVYPILKHISENKLLESNNRSLASPISIIPIIGACAEAFPAGECWTSSSQDYWYELSKPDCVSSMNDVMYCHGSSPDDLSLIIFLLSDLLKVFGGPGGDMEAQSWILLTLIRFTETSTIMVQNFTENPDALAPLGSAWRDVWETLFRPELRYYSYTEEGETNSLGELVLILITEMVQHNCADPVLSSPRRPIVKPPSFVFDMQAQVWNLPAFSSRRPLKTTSVFELICAMLQQVGLSESGSDNIDISFGSKLFPQEFGMNSTIHGLQRRRRLFCFILGKFESMMATYLSREKQKAYDQRFFAAFSATLVALLHGKSVNLATSFSIGISFATGNSAFRTDDPICNRFRLTCLHNIKIQTPKCVTFEEALMKCLWSLEDIPRESVDAEIFSRQQDLVNEIAARLRSRQRLREGISSEYADFVSEAESDFLHNRTLIFFERRMKKPVEPNSSLTPSSPFKSGDDSDDSGSESVKFPQSWQTLSAKIALSESLCRRDEVLQGEVKVVIGNVMPILDESSSSLSSLCDFQEEFLEVSSNLLQIVKALLEVSLSYTNIGISHSSLDSLIDTCKSLLGGYASRLRNGNSHEVQTALAKYYTKSRVSRDDFMDENDEALRGHMSDDTDDSLIAKSGSESDDDIRDRRKRRSLPNPRRSKPKRRLVEPAKPLSAAPDWLCAKQLGSIVTTLEPSFSNCEFVCQSLLGTELDVEPSSVDGDVNIRSGIHCAEFLTDESVLYHQTAMSTLVNRKDIGDSESSSNMYEGSLVVMVSRVIELLRSAAGPSSTNFVFGYQQCARVIRLSESDVRGQPINKKETISAVELLKFEDGIQSRPYLRFNRIRAATDAFLSGGNELHSVFDRYFTQHIVKPALCDSDSRIRREACVAVSAAISALDERKTSESVLKLVSPITLSINRDEVNKEFGAWYDKMRFGPSLDDAKVKDLAALNDFELLLSESILCRSMISGSARNTEVFRKACLDLLLIPRTRPELEFACFLALNRVATMRDYCRVEDMVEHECGGFLTLWLEAGERVDELPLAVSAPNIVRRFLQAGKYYLLTSRVSGGPNEGGGKVDMLRVRREAAISFATKCRRFLVPLTLIQIGCQEPNSATENEGTNSDPKLPCDATLKHITELLVGDCNEEENVKKLLHCHIQDIRAFCLPMVHCDVLRYQQVGKTILDLVASALPEGTIQSQSKKKSHIVVRRILELSGKSQEFVGSLPESQAAYYDAIVAFVDEFCSSNVYNGDIFLQIGSSLTESLILSFVWLDKSLLSTHKMQRWSTLDLLVKFILSQIQRSDYDRTQLGFCIHILLEVILSPGLVCIRLCALKSLRDVLDAAFEINLDESGLQLELTSVLQRLIAACFHIHELSQQMFLSKCCNKTQARLRQLRRSLGLCGTHDIAETGGDVWGWDVGLNQSKTSNTVDVKAAIQDFGSSIDANIHGSITETFGILESIISNEGSLGLDAQAFVGTTPPYAVSEQNLEQLFVSNPRLCAQRLTQSFIERVEDVRSDPKPLILGILKKLSNRQSWMRKTVTVVRRPGYSQKTNLSFDLSSMNMDQRLLYAELVQLERILHVLRKQREDAEVGQLESQDCEFLVRELSNVCGSSCPDQLRFAASRCLGMISPSRIAGLFFSEIVPLNGTDSIGVAIENNDLVTLLQARGVEVLGECLKSPKTKIAMVAAETLEALFATTEGPKCWRLLKEPAIKGLLEPFLNKNRAPRKEFSSCLAHQVANLRRKAGAETEHRGSWCWNEKLWQCRESDQMSYEEWICILVPALIVCCYMEQNSDGMEGGETPGNGEFFRQCINICLLEDEFCSAIFPCIIIDLLKDSQAVSYSGLVAGGTSVTDTSGMQEHLSKAFSILLNHSSTDVGSENSSQPEPKAIALAIDTLDLLRRVSQNKFLSFAYHQRNIISLPGRSYGDQTPKKKSRPASQSPAIYNRGLPPPSHWRGLPYGTVMNLDGLLVAKSCMQIRRFASALFYVDLHLNAELGLSGGILEQISKECGNYGTLLCHRSASDVSGFSNARDADSSTPLDADNVRETALSSMAVIGKCFQELHEEEALGAIETQSSALNFLCNDVDENIDSTKRGSLQTLQRLDTRSSLVRASVSTPLLIADCMEELGLRRILQTYIEGLVSKSNVAEIMYAATQHTLREKWFEGSFYARRWGNQLPCATSIIPESEITFGSQPSLAPIDQIPNFFTTHSLDVMKNDSGFFESFSAALDAFTRDDLKSSLSLLAQGRRALLNDIANTSGEETPLSSMAFVADRLQALGDLERIASGSETPDKLLGEWLLTPHVEADDRTTFCNFPKSRHGVDSSLNGDTMGLAFQGFSSCAREIMLRIFHYKGMGGSSLIGSLTYHLWNMCTRSRHTGHVTAAEAALERLLAVLRMNADTEDGSNTSFETILQLRLEESKIMESRGDFTSAIRRCKQTIDLLTQKKRKEGGLEDSVESLLADALVTCGSWMTVYKVQQAKVVLDSYLRPGAQLARKIYESDRSLENAETSTTALLALAQLVTDLHEALSNRVQSKEWRKTAAGIADQEQELQRCEPLISDATRRYQKVKKNAKAAGTVFHEIQELEIYRQTLRKDIQRSKVERENIEKSVGAHLNTAINSFASALSHAGTGTSTEMSRHVFRMVSLWFKRCNDTRKDENVNDLMTDAIEEIPTFRFVPLTNQLFSRIEKHESEDIKFQKTLQRLIFKMCVDHPYHCIVQLIALSNGKNVGSGVSGRNVSAFLENVGDSKVAAACELLAKLKEAKQEFIGKLVESYQSLTDAYIHLSHASTDKFHRTTTKNIPFSKIGPSSRVTLDNCLGGKRNRVQCPPCILTAPPPLRPGCDYGDGMEDPIGAERIAHFDSSFSVTETGLHRPKIVICNGSKGGRYRQLAKGEDEIRQDAVMSQVFTYVNELMRRRGAATHGLNTSQFDDLSGLSLGFVKHKLNVVRYNIVPLSPASGVLEWVENTMPFGEYMLDKRGSRAKGYRIGAHSKYYPGEWGNTLCRLHLLHAPPSAKRESYDEICHRHSPVFRFFFIERFGHSMQAWHAAKMKYTRSVAVSSIVGHILGIGDRHSSNILVHQKTGEVVHIDFGIVFEQGKLLNTPERVPFRLTRNMIDGMGPSGTEGTFFRAAEETSKILRDNANSLLTILSAIVEDPLYRWSISPVKARRRQTAKDEEAEGRYETIAEHCGSNAYVEADDLNSHEEHNKDAAQAITKIHEKLQGYEDGTSGEQQSIEGQVQLLINSARDPDNLCQMYVGWAPWM